MFKILVTEWRTYVCMGSARDYRRRSYTGDSVGASRGAILPRFAPTWSYSAPSGLGSLILSMLAARVPRRGSVVSSGDVPSPNGETVSFFRADITGGGWLRESPGVSQLNPEMRLLQPVAVSVTKGAFRRSSPRIQLDILSLHFRIELRYLGVRRRNGGDSERGSQTTADESEEEDGTHQIDYWAAGGPWWSGMRMAVGWRGSIGPRICAGASRTGSSGSATMGAATMEELKIRRN
ncbi:hypothetical protein C8Q70DRAFT_930815 [Cubamyces menziesii]|nr:hypothetical protein C8Q70DRAFT_930815 [Cubamyces menziesii]